MNISRNTRKHRKLKSPKRRHPVHVAADIRSGAGPHKTRKEKRTQNKELKEIQEQLEN